MTPSQSWLWLSLIVGMVALGMAGLLSMWRANPGAPSSLLDRLDSALISVEGWVSGECSEPTPKAGACPAGGSGQLRVDEGWSVFRPKISLQYANRRSYIAHGSKVGG